MYSDETIVADDRLSIVLRPTMLLIDFKIQVADIAYRKKKSGFWLVLVQILFSACQTRSINKKNKMAVVDCVYGNSNNSLTNKGDRFVYPSSGVTMSSFSEFTMFYRLKRNPPNKIKLDSMSQTV